MKHTQLLIGTKENLIKISKSLLELGYTEFDFSKDYKFLIEGSGSNCSCIQIGPDSGCKMLISEFAAWDVNLEKNTHDYTFHIDNESEFNCAVAIAAIHDDEDFHQHEWVIATKTTQYHTEGKLYQIGGKQWNEIEQQNWNKNALLVKCNDRGDGHGRTVDGREDARKATPEEIINHFNPNKKQNMEKVITGYKLKEEKRTFLSAIEAITDEVYEEGELKVNTEEVKLLEQAGVLSIWFDEVYESEYKEGTIFRTTKTSTEIYRITNIVDQGDEITADLERLDHKEAIVTNYRVDKSWFFQTKKDVKPFEASGYKAKKQKANEEDVIAFGCQTFNLLALQTVLKLLINGATISFKEQKVSKEDILNLIIMLTVN